MEDVFCGQKLTDSFRVFADTYEDSFIVTKYTDVASVLIEMGYSTNEAEAKKLLSDDWQGDFVKTLADEICYAFGK